MILPNKAHDVNYNIYKHIILYVFIPGIIFITTYYIIHNIKNNWILEQNLVRYGDWSLIDQRKNHFNPRLTGLSGNLYYSLSLRDIDFDKNYRFTFSCNSNGKFLNININTKTIDDKIMLNGFKIKFNDYVFYIGVKKPDNLSYFERSAHLEFNFVKVGIDDNYLKILSKSQSFNVKIMVFDQFADFNYHPTGTYEAFNEFLNKCNAEI